MLASLAKEVAGLVSAPLPRTADQWADENRVLPAGSAEPGKWRSSRNPYMIGIVRAHSRPGISRVVYVMATQMGKSASMFNIIGHRLDDDPAPIIYIGPTQSNIDNVVEPKIVEMLKNCKSLWGKTAKGQQSTKHHKRISGVSLRLGWAGSATELASDSAAIALVDEYDRMLKDISKEGDPVEQADARTGTYPDGVTSVTSTPKLGQVETVVDHRTGVTHWQRSETVSSPVWKLWQEGSRHEWAIPCPECNDYFIPRFRLLWWPDKYESIEHAGRQSRMTCACCGAQIEDRYRDWMNARGVFIAPGQKADTYIEGATGVTLTDYTETTTQPYYVEYGDFKLTTENQSNATFWVSGLCSFSSKKSYGFLTVKWLKAVRSGDSERIQGVINTDFGELYTVSGDAPEWEAVKAHAQNYLSGTVPDKANALFLTVDVQKNRLVYVVRAWRGRKSWLIEQGELFGNTEDFEVWDQLGKFRESVYDGYVIKRAFVDSGYRTSEVYTFCRRFKGWAYPTKGQETQDKPVKPALIDVNHEGKVIKKGLQLWHLNSDYFKTWVHDRVEQDPDSSGWYLPQDIDEDYCKQIVAEAKVEKASGRTAWVRLKPDNHYLDCEYMQAATAQIYGLLRRVDNKPVDNGGKIASNKPKRRQISRGVK